MEPVAAAIRIPEIGARNVPEIPAAWIRLTICTDKSEAAMSPAIPPAPIRISTVAVILLRPDEV
ncbi:hypothetical protein D3C87_1936290 [compost metagenome]